MYTPPDSYNMLNGFKRPPDAINPVNELDNQLFIHGSIEVSGTVIDSIKMQNVLQSNDLMIISTSANITTSGLVLINGGSGGQLIKIDGLPTPGVKLDILLKAIISGVVTVKTHAGSTFDGTNNTATFNAAGDELVLCYLSSTQWQIFKNNSVTLSIT